MKNKQTRMDQNNQVQGSKDLFDDLHQIEEKLRRFEPVDPAEQAERQLDAALEKMDVQEPDESAYLKLAEEQLEAALEKLDVQEPDESAYQKLAERQLEEALEKFELREPSESEFLEHNERQMEAALNKLETQEPDESAYLEKLLHLEVDVEHPTDRRERELDEFLDRLEPVDPLEQAERQIDAVLEKRDVQDPDDAKQGLEGRSEERE